MKIPSYCRSTRLVMALGLITAATTVAQTSSCIPGAQSVLNTATGRPGWMLNSGPGVSVPRPAVDVLNPNVGWTPRSGASWVSVDSAGGSVAGQYAYEFDFCVCQVEGASLTLSYFADNAGTVLLNGMTLPGAGLAGPKGFTGKPAGLSNYTGPLLQAGLNRLVIVVENDGSVTGLNAILKVVGAVAGPCGPGCPSGASLTTHTGLPGWTLASSPGVAVSKPAVTVSKPTPGWSVLPGTSWVSVDSAGGNLAGAYTFEFEFCLCQLPGTALALSYFADNGATVLLNGTPISAASKPEPKGFTGTPGGVVNYTGPGFVVGNNVLTIVVIGDNYKISFWTAAHGNAAFFQPFSTNNLTTTSGNGIDTLVYAGSGLPAPGTPEPASIFMIVTGLIGICIGRRHRGSR